MYRYQAIHQIWYVQITFIMEKFFQCTSDISCFSSQLLNSLLETSNPRLHQFHIIFIMRSNTLLFHRASISKIILNSWVLL